MNVYAYCRNNPVIAIDNSGTQTKENNPPLLAAPTTNPTIGPQQQNEMYFGGNLQEINIYATKPASSAPLAVETGLTTINKPYPRETVDFSQWKYLLEFSPPDSVMNAADDRIVGLNPQPLSEAYGDSLNIDLFTVNITKLPLGYTAESLLEEIRTSFTAIKSTAHSTFGPYNEDEGKKWQSKNPLSSVMRFQVYSDWGINLEEMSVITSQKQKDNWIFSPVFAVHDLNHPLAGNRQFGITTNSDNTFTFYTKGVDRPWGGLDLLAENSIFKGADQLWNSVMDNVISKVNKMGGEANRGTAFSKRVSWSLDYKK